MDVDQNQNEENLDPAEVLTEPKGDDQNHDETAGDDNDDATQELLDLPSNDPGDRFLRKSTTGTRKGFYNCILHHFLNFYINKKTIY